MFERLEERKLFSASPTQPSLASDDIGSSWYTVSLPDATPRDTGLTEARPRKGETGLRFRDIDGRLRVSDHSDNAVRLDANTVLVRADSEEAAIRDGIAGSISILGRAEITFGGVNSGRVFDVGTRNELIERHTETDASNEITTKVNFSRRDDYLIALEDQPIDWGPDRRDEDFDDWFWKVDVEEVSFIEELTIRSEAHPDNEVVKPLIGPGQILYVEDEPDNLGIQIEFSARYNESSILDSSVYWSVVGPGTTPFYGEFDSPESFSSQSLPLLGTGSFSVNIGFDGNGNGQLDENETVIASEVVGVRVDELVVTEINYESNTVSAVDFSSVANAPKSYVALQANNTAPIKIDVGGLPLTPEAGRNVLYEVNGAGISARGNFGAADPVVTLDPNTPSGAAIYDVIVGFDDNGNGVLDVDEQSRRIQVNPFSITLTVGDGSVAGRSVSYKADLNLHDREEYAGYENLTITVEAEQVGIPDSAWTARLGITQNSDAENAGFLELTSSRTWEYEAPTEFKSNTDPQDIVVQFEASLAGSDRRSDEASKANAESDINITYNQNELTVRSLYKYLSGTSFIDDKSLALKYVNDKYEIVGDAIFEGNFNYAGIGPVQGLTYRTLTEGIEVDIYDAAFQNENVLASTIGHENEHFSQWRSYLFR